MQRLELEVSEKNRKEFRDLVERFTSKHKANQIKYAAFSIPIKNGELYLAIRNTPPSKGLYCAIGGKIDKKNQESINISLGIPIHRGSGRLVEMGFERPTVAAIREFCEEMYSNKQFPRDFDIDNQFRIMRLGSFGDVNTGVDCYMRLLEVPEDLPFKPSPREIGKIDKVSNIDPKQLNPLTAVALDFIKIDPELSQYKDQIPSLDVVEVKYFWLCSAPLFEY